MGVETSKPCCCCQKHKEKAEEHSSDQIQHQASERRSSGLLDLEHLDGSLHVTHHTGGHHGDHHHNHSSGNCLIDTLLGEDHTSFDALIQEVSDTIKEE